MGRKQRRRELHESRVTLGKTSIQVRTWALIDDIDVVLAGMPERPPLDPRAAIFCPGEGSWRPMEWFKVVKDMQRAIATRQEQVRAAAEEEAKKEGVREKRRQRVRMRRTARRAELGKEGMRAVEKDRIERKRGRQADIWRAISKSQTVVPVVESSEKEESVAPVVELTRAEEFVQRKQREKTEREARKLEFTRLWRAAGSDMGLLGRWAMTPEREQVQFLDSLRKATPS